MILVLSLTLLGSMACLGATATTSGPKPSNVLAPTAPTSARLPLGRIGPTATAPDTRIALLEQQIAITRNFQSDLLATVYWALSFLGGLTVVLVTYNWVTYSWRHKRERRALMRTLRNTVKTHVTESEQRLRAEAQTERARIDTALEALRVDLYTRIEQSAAAVTETTNAAMSARNRELTERMEAADKHVKWLVDYEGARLSHFRLDAAIEAKRWIVAIVYALRLIKEATPIGMEVFVQAGLEALRIAIASGGKFTQEVFDDAPVILKAVPEKFRGEAEEILRGLSKEQVV